MRRASGRTTPVQQKLHLETICLCTWDTEAKVAPRNEEAFAIQDSHHSTRRDRRQAREVSEKNVAYRKVALGSLAPCRTQALARPKGRP